MNSEYKINPSGINLNNFQKVDNKTTSGNVTVFFRDLKRHLIESIKKYDMILGAVAWITDYEILEELSKKKSLLVIQKEDFLRPDMKSNLSTNDKLTLKKLYSSFNKFDATKIATGPFFQDISEKYKNLPPILCYGIYNKDKMYMTPRMHNKFLTFLKKEGDLYFPKAVWTGSLNLTQLSLHSLENAVLIKDDSIANAYAEEMQLLYLNSDTLNWSSEWVNPFLRARLKE